MVDDGLDGDIDFEALDGLRDSMGDVFGSLLDTYRTTMVENFEVLNKAVEESDCKTLERVVHSIKSSSANFGGIRVSKLAKMLEDKYREGDIQNSRQEMVALEADYQAFQAKLDEYGNQ